MLTPRQSADLDRWILRGPDDDDSGDVTHCERCSELTPREHLNIYGNCEICAEDMGEL
jgi:hypothetical protein